MCTNNQKKTPLITVAEEPDSDLEVDESDALPALEKALDSMTGPFYNQSIVVISFNVVVKTREGVYIPCEVGLIEFTVEGIVEEYTRLIANEVPTGYYGVANGFSQKYHKISVNPGVNDHFTDDYLSLFNRIYGLMSSSTLKDDQNRKVVVFKAVGLSGLSDRDQVRGCLLWLDKQISNQEINKSLVKDFVIVDIADLLFLASQKFYSLPSDPKKWAIDTLNDDVFDYWTNMRCRFHAEDDNLFCALLAAKKSALLFIKSLKPYVPIVVIKESEEPKDEPPKEPQSILKHKPIATGIGRGRRLMERCLSMRKVRFDLRNEM